MMCRSQQAPANERDLNLESNLQKGNVGDQGPSAEADELVHDPVSESREEDEDDGAGKTHPPVGDQENSDHAATEEESDLICRTCGPDEEIPTDPDNPLVQLGCHCRGSLRLMHRQCILEWYGRRMCQDHNFNCELCNAVLHGRIESIVSRALNGQDSGAAILSRVLPPAILSRVLRPNEEGRNAPPEFHRIDIEESTRRRRAQLYNEFMRRRAELRDEIFLQDIRDNCGYCGFTQSGFPICAIISIILVFLVFGILILSSGNVN